MLLAISPPMQARRTLQRTQATIALSTNQYYEEEKSEDLEGGRGNSFSKFGDEFGSLSV